MYASTMEEKMNARTSVRLGRDLNRDLKENIKSLLVLYMVHSLYAQGSVKELLIKMVLSTA
jgi:hypothetical protein